MILHGWPKMEFCGMRYRANGSARKDRRLSNTFDSQETHERKASKAETDTF